MGFRQPRIQSVALALGFLALGAAACGSGPAKGPNKVGPGTTAPPDAGPDVEALQIQTIAGALNEFGPAVHTCWARAAADDFKVSGQLILDLTIQDGGLATVSVTTDEVQDEVLSECLVSLWSAYRWPPSFVAGDRIQLPPFEFVAPDAQYVVASDHVAIATRSVPAVKMQNILHKANTGNGAASVARLRYAPGTKIALHSHPSAQIFFVLSGDASIANIGKSQRVSAGSAVYVPAGTLHGFTEVGEAPLDTLQFFVPGGPEEGLFDDGNPSEHTTYLKSKLPKRGPRPLVRSVADAEALPILGGKAEVRILFDASISGDKSAYLGAMVAKPGVVVPLHRHSESSEYLFVIEGDAEMTVAGKVIPVRAGDGIQIPPGVEHGVTISGGADFKAIQLYSPAGPEQRFKAGSK